jgi:uncharacterized phage protein gp47/JayE
MPFTRPTLTALRTTAIEDITTSGVPGLDGLLRNAVLRVLAWVMSGLAYSLYGYLDWIARQSVPFTATDEFLESWAALIAVYRKDATAATGSARFVGGTPGLVVPLGSTLTRQDGTPYTATDDATVDGTGTVLVPILAAVTGAATDCDDGTPISLDPPIPGINSGGVTVGPTTGGSDQETQADLRTRMLFKYADPPQGGAASDYVSWALEVPGCTRAWIAPQGHGPGSVVVYPMFDIVNIADGGFPMGTDGVATLETRDTVATGDQLAVADYIFPLRPVTALVWVAAPAPLRIDVSLAALDPATVEIETEIAAALNDMFLVVGEVAGTIYPSQLYDAISSTPGVNHFVMTAPIAAVVATAGQLPVLGTLTVA